MLPTASLMTGCACCSRRRFLAGCAGAAAAGTLVPLLGHAAPAPAPANEKTRIRIVWTMHSVKLLGPDWPNKGFDLAPVMERIGTGLAQLCPTVDFVFATADGPEQAKKIIDGDRTAAIDGYIVYQLTCWRNVVQTIATSGKPVLHVDFKYGGSGGFLIYTAGLLRAAAANVGIVSSERIEDVAAAVKCIEAVKRGAPVSGFAAATAQVRRERMPPAGDPACTPDPVQTLSPEECVRRLRASKMLVVRDNTTTGAGKPLCQIPLQHVTFDELNGAWKAADKDQSRAIADGWQKAARAVVGVSRETLESSAAMYVGMQALLKKHAANAITINCLGGFYGGHIHAYPCLGFHELCNAGLVGGCEADVYSAAAMVLLTTLTQGRTGFISDPVIDTSKRQIIYVHCVAPSRALGPQGPTNPFEILTHSEDRQGAAVRSILPVGYMTTTIDVRLGQIIMHQGKAVANDPDDRACRTKLCVEPVGDMDKLFTMWDHWGWHRVTCHGDLRAPVTAVAEALQCKIVAEA